jgi:hypothetical protein
MDSQSVKTTERGGVRGFDAHKRVKGRKRHILVDTSGLLIACRVAPADISDRTSATQLLGGLGPLFPNIRTIIADAGHESRKLSRHLMQQDGCVATSGLLAGDVKESRNGNPTRDLQMATDRTRIHTLCGPVVSSLFSFAARC